MHCLLHDFAGHPFQVELSRALAARDHRITHGWFISDSGPKGALLRQDGDAAELEFQPFGAGIPYSKANFRQRRSGDIAYGRSVGDWIISHRPDVVLSGNTPTEAQEGLVAACRAAGIPFVYWCQDFYSIAVARLLSRKSPGIGHLIGGYYRHLERRQMRRSARIVHITEAFCHQTDAWDIGRDRVVVIPNWGAIDQIGLQPRDNDWSAAQGLGPGARFLYAGTLAMKHNPGLLAGLARALGALDEVVLVSAGVGADALAADVAAGMLPRLRALPLQPFEVFDLVLGSADVLLAVIERDAGAFSVPSKILSYLCAGRPVVLAAPADNLAAQIVRATGAGRVVEPEDVAGFIAAALAYRDDPLAAKAAGAAGRAYAEANFELSSVADRFEAVLKDAVSGC